MFRLCPFKAEGGAEFEAVVEAPLVSVENEYGEGTTAELAMYSNTIIERWLDKGYAHWHGLSLLNLEREFSDRFFKARR